MCKEHEKKVKQVFVLLWAHQCKQGKRSLPLVRVEVQLSKLYTRTVVSNDNKER